MATDAKARTEAMNFLLGAVCPPISHIWYTLMFTIWKGDVESHGGQKSRSNIFCCHEEGGGSVRLVPLRTADYDCLMNLYRKKGMSGDELIVLNHVQAAKNQGM